MDRRSFISMVGGSIFAAPLATQAQRLEHALIGYLSMSSPEESAHLLAAFRQGLNEGGFVEGQNVTIEYRWALGQYDRLPALATELARQPLAVLVSTGGEPVALAAKASVAAAPRAAGVRVWQTTSENRARMQEALPLVGPSICRRSWCEAGAKGGRCTAYCPDMGVMRTRRQIALGSLGPAEFVPRRDS